MNWYKKAKIILPYPYYIAIYYEGQLKGQYPREIAFSPDLKRKWDSGQLGTGKRPIELVDNTVSGLLDKVKDAGKDPRYDDIEYYLVKSPNSYRDRIPYTKLIDLL